MRHFVFQSKGEAELYGVTADKAGASLDQARGPWAPFREVNIVPGQPKTPAIPDAQKALDDIAATGAHYTKAGVLISITE